MPIRQLTDGCLEVLADQLVKADEQWDSQDRWDR
jgi:hypothetical protein